MNEYFLEYRLEHDEPVDTADLGRMFEALSRDYTRFVTQFKDVPAPDAVRLSVRNVRPGSIAVDLIAVGVATLPFIENAANVLQFGEYLYRGYQLLLKGGDRERPPDPGSLTDTLAELEPVARDRSAVVNLIGKVDGDVHYHFHVNSVEANAIQNNARRELGVLQEPTKGLHERVALYFFQARNDPRSHSGDRGIIETIHGAPVKVTFHTKALKAQVLSGRRNLFKQAYIVDVIVETVYGKPVLYNVIALHDTVDRPEAA